MVTLILGKSWSHNKVRIKTKSIYKHATFFIYFNLPYQPHVEKQLFSSSIHNKNGQLFPSTNHNKNWEKNNSQKPN
jgi:hypothetical protein